MPQGWVHGRLGTIATVVTGQSPHSNSSEIAMVLARLFEGDTDGFVAWIGERTKSLVQAYDLAIREADLETVSGFMQVQARRPLPSSAPERGADDERINHEIGLPFMDEWTVAGVKP